LLIRLESESPIAFAIGTNYMGSLSWTIIVINKLSLKWRCL